MMKFKLNETDEVDAAGLIAKLLGAHPFGPGDALQGLGASLRRVFELAVEVGARPELTIRLKVTEDEARAHGWPSLASANLSMLLVWSLIQPRRRVKGLPFAELAAGEGDAETPVETGSRLRALTIDELIDELERPIGGEFDPSNLNAANVYPVPVHELLRSSLGLDPETLRFHRNDIDIPAAADAHARLGLELLLRDAISQYTTMRARRTTAIRLMSEDDANDVGVEDVRAAHIATLFASALHAEAGTSVYFRAPRTRSTDEKAMLRATAACVYLDPSDEALQGFELVCDRMVHFGHGNNWTLAEKLLSEVAASIDPDLQKAPYAVAVQHAISSAFR